MLSASLVLFLWVQWPLLCDEAVVDECHSKVLTDLVVSHVLQLLLLLSTGSLVYYHGWLKVLQGLPHID
jgi:uncharacterized protein (DUF488 family)